MKFGGLVALDSVSFQIRRGEILGLIGPTGVGKTTCFNAMTGVCRPTSGEVLLEGGNLGRSNRKQAGKPVCGWFVRPVDNSPGKLVRPGRVDHGGGPAGS
jgi:ABC-type branched-subunit amino acid transport system ATPase component